MTLKVQLLRQPFYSPMNPVWDCPGEQAPERQNEEGKRTNSDLLEQEIVSGSGISWAICNAYSLRPPARSPVHDRLPIYSIWFYQGQWILFTVLYIGLGPVGSPLVLVVKVCYP